jgi:hypothetical protein
VINHVNVELETDALIITVNVNISPDSVDQGISETQDFSSTLTWLPG